MPLIDPLLQGLSLGGAHLAARRNLLQKAPLIAYRLTTTPVLLGATPVAKLHWC